MSDLQVFASLFTPDGAWRMPHINEEFTSREEIRAGSSQLNYSLYHDRYERTPVGWKFAERLYEVRYLDTTPLRGTPWRDA